ncbi:PE family protein [Mycobacterium riyadhense]|uniref:PE family protein n=1 Tax=Mycobacterium riyadhense TaxID=486698 RepID=UPI0023BA8F76|nr:PE family protein [Mycobacterium riyadhense]
MAFVFVSSEVLAAAAADLSALGSTIGAASAAAAGATTGLASAAQDEVSAAIAALFSQHGRDYQVLAGRVAGFHDEFTRALAVGGRVYAGAEAVNVGQLVLDAVNAPTEVLVGRALIGDGADGASGAVGQRGGDGGLLFGSGGSGGSSSDPGRPGVRGVRRVDRQWWGRRNGWGGGTGGAGGVAGWCWAMVGLVGPVGVRPRWGPPVGWVVLVVRRGCLAMAGRVGPVGPTPLVMVVTVLPGRAAGLWVTCGGWGWWGWQHLGWYGRGRW